MAARPAATGSFSRACAFNEKNVENALPHFPCHAPVLALTVSAIPEIGGWLLGPAATGSYRWCCAFLAA